MLIKIVEKYSGRPSYGGTSFTLVARGRSTIDYCRVQDHFNGNYTAMCPIHEGSVKITTNVNFLAYNVFTSNQKALDTTLWKPIVASRYMSEKKAKSLRTRVEYRTCRKWNVSKAVHCGACEAGHHGSSVALHDGSSEALHSGGWWHRVSDEWSWFTGSCVVPVTKYRRLRDCIDSVAQVIII